MVRDATATRARILAAAIEEFSTYGLAGARIERIAEASGANPRLIYVHFKSKEQLFATALHQVITKLAEAVPLTEDDLPGYAGRMFDYLLCHPEAVRLTTWRQLERPAVGPDLSQLYAAKVAAMSRRRGGGTGAGDLPPMDLLAFVSALTSAWFNSPEGLLAADGSDVGSAERIASHRAALVEAARRLSTPSTPD